MTTADTKGHTMNRTITTAAVGALTLTTLLTGCGQDAAKPAPTTSTPTQHIKGGNDPRYKQGVDAWLEFTKAVPGDLSKPIPSTAAEHATESAISAETDTRKSWATGQTELGKVKSVDVTTTVQKYQGMDIYLDTPTQPYEMTVRVCGTTKGSLTTDKGKQKVERIAPATLFLKSADKGKTWKINKVDVNAPSTIKLGCEQDTSSPSSASPSKG